MSESSATRHVSAARREKPRPGFFAQRRGTRGRLPRRTPLDWLLGLLLVVQLLGAGSVATPKQPDFTASATSLSAVLGAPVPICLHDGDPGDPTPTMPADCGHCTLCHGIAADFTLATLDAIATPATIVSTLTHPFVSWHTPTTRPAGSASSRGPPRLV